MADAKQGMLLTNAGAALLARVMNGEKLVFTRGAFGDSIRDGQIVIPDTAEQAELEHLINERLSLPLIKITPTGAYAELDMQVITAQVDESFMVSEIGLFAKIDNGNDDEPEKLYGYFNAGLKGDYMPAKYSSIAKDYVYTVVIVIGNAQNVTAIINRTDYDLPIATESVLGGIMLSDDFYTEANGKLHLANPSVASIPVATESVLGGIMLGDEFYMREVNDTNATDGKLRLSGIVRNSVSIRGGLAVRDSVQFDDYSDVYGYGVNVSLTGGNVRLVDENIYLSGANGKKTSIKGADDLDVDIFLPNVKVTLGSSTASLPAYIRATDAKVSLDSSAIRANDATIYSSANSHVLTFDTKTNFSDVVSISVEDAKGGLDATKVSLRGPVRILDATVTANSLPVAENYCTIQATNSDIDLTNATIRGVPSLTGGFSVGGTAKFTGIADFRDATVRGIDSGGVTIEGITNPFNGVLSLTSGADSLDGGKIIMRGQSEGQAPVIDMSGHDYYSPSIKASGMLGGVLDLSGISEGGKIIMGGYSDCKKSAILDLTNSSWESPIKCDKGASIIACGYYNGGIISLQGHRTGGTIDASGFSFGGTIDMSGDYNGGIISLQSEATNGSGGSICGDVHFTGTPIFENGFDNRGGGGGGGGGGDSNYFTGTVSIRSDADTLNGGKIDMSGDYNGGIISLQGDVNGGKIDMSGDTTGGRLYMYGGASGGEIDLHGDSDVGGKIKLYSNSDAGGEIDMHGTRGGEIDLSGGSDVGGKIKLYSDLDAAGEIDLHGATYGGVIKMTGGNENRGGSITGSPHFPQGFFVGDGTQITKIWIDSDKLKVTAGGSTYTFTPDA